MLFKQKVIIIVFITIAVAIGFFFLLKDSQFSKDISKITNEEIVGLLKKNKESLDYMEKYKDLYLKNNRYLKINLINSIGNRGLIAVLDLKTETVPKAYNLILIKASL